MKKFFQEFKAFISRGNVMDLAVGVIIGSAFTGVVTALTDSIISRCSTVSAARRSRARFICWEIIIWTTARFCPLW